MTAPDTNVEKQVSRHKPALGGISVAVLTVFIVVALVALWPREQADGEVAATGSVVSTN